MKGLAVILVIFAVIIWIMAHSIMPISYKPKSGKPTADNTENNQITIGTTTIEYSRFSDYIPINNSTVTETNPVIAMTINPDGDATYIYSVELSIIGKEKLYKAFMTPTIENRNRYFHNINDSLIPDLYEIKVTVTDDKKIQSTTWYFELISDLTGTSENIKKRTVSETDEEIDIKLINVPENIKPTRRVYEIFKFFKEMPLLTRNGYSEIAYEYYYITGKNFDEEIDIKLINVPENIKPTRRVYETFKFFKEMPLLTSKGYSEIAYEYYYITGKNFDDAFLNVAESVIGLNNEKSLTISTKKPEVTYKYYAEFDIVPKIRITDVKISYQDTIMLPYWDIPKNIDKNQLTYWNTFLKELWNHEYKHISMNSDALNRIKTKLESISIITDLSNTGIGPELIDAYTKIDNNATKVIDDVWGDTCKYHNKLDNTEYDKIFTKTRYTKPK